MQGTEAHQTLPKQSQGRDVVVIQDNTEVKWREQEASKVKANADVRVNRYKLAVEKDCLDI